MPMLDTQMWVEHLDTGDVVRFEYYEKECTSPLVVMNQTAMATHKKVQILANEVIRRMRNTDRITVPRI